MFSNSKGVTLKVKVIPKSSINKIIGWEGDFLKIRINAIPEKGKVNALLIKFLAKTLKIPQSNITIIAGETCRLKTLCIKGVTNLDGIKVL